MAEFHLTASVQGTSIVHAGSLSHCHGATVDIISNNCAFPSMTSQNVNVRLSAASPLSLPCIAKLFKNQRSVSYQYLLHTFQKQ